MHFNIICPVRYLDRFARQSKRHLVIAQWCRNLEYFEFYRKRGQEGDYITLDNGAYEGLPLDRHEYVELINTLEPNEVVLPDRVGDAEHTLAASMRFQVYWYEQNKFGCLETYVFHNAFEDEFLDELLVVTNTVNPDVIAFPRWMKEKRLRYVRAYLTAVKEHHFAWSFRALGWTGSLDELRTLDQFGCTEVDTSAPVWRGLYGHTLHDPQWPDHPFNPFSVPRSPNIELAQKNLDEIMEACGAS